MKIADFGISQIILPSERSEARQRGGTLNYIVTKFYLIKPVGTANDLWALACLMHVEWFPWAPPVGSLWGMSKGTMEAEKASNNGS